MCPVQTEIYLFFQNMLINCMLKINCGHIWRCCCEERNAAEGNCEEYCKREKDLCHIGTAELYVRFAEACDAVLEIMDMILKTDCC